MDKHEGFTLDQISQQLKEPQSGDGNADQVISVLFAASQFNGSLEDGLLATDNPFLEWWLGLGGHGAGSSKQPRRQMSQEADSEPRDASTTVTDSALAGIPIEDPTALADKLKARVIGQEGVIQHLVRRLAVTRADLDIRPERPDGAFLFVGPTGVGKTELARALAGELLGSEASLIRLDMSEYSHDWGVSRLTGPMPGYVGSDQPASWLTTRIRKQPESVLLLDEIEKAHPIVWNIFLQALDAGRLTDSRGKVADFSKVIVVMTSNLGSEAFTSNPLGFADREAQEETRDEREAAGVQGEVRYVLPPELINRLDGILTFRALNQEDILRIAMLEIHRLCERLSGRGIDLEVAPEVCQFIANEHYDRRYGARHLQRNLERFLVEPIALGGAREGKVVAELEGGSVAVRID